MDQQKTPPIQKEKNGENWRKKRNRRRNHHNKNKNRDANAEAVNEAALDALEAQDEDIEDGEESTPVNSEKLDMCTVESLEKEDEKTMFGTDPDAVEVTVSIENEEEEVKTIHVAGIRFKPNGKIYFFDNTGITLKNGGHAIVDTARGLEYGEVAFADKEVKESSLVLPLRNVVRAATEEDAVKNQQNKIKEEEAFKICLERIEKHELNMKLIEAQYSFDNSKLLFYFTSANRVDFRGRVKDLAGVFRTRIELRQIGIRDEAKIMGGLGACGRPLCCATFLSDFVQVSIKMAKEQNLSLNSGKISGCCGRLMCCLQYEYKTYREEGAKTPSVGSTVRTRDGVGIVTDSNILAGVIKVRLNDKPDVPPASYKRDEVTVLNRAKVEDDD